jgi:hypothetical protein
MKDEIKNLSAALMLAMTVYYFPRVVLSRQSETKKEFLQINQFFCPALSV